MKIIVVGMLMASCGLFTLAMAAPAVPATKMQDDDKPSILEGPTPFMKRKLVASKNIVSGLATEDLELIAKNAQDLMLLSQEADWKVLTTREYLSMSNDFRASAGRLRKAGQEKNLDAATLAYFEVTLNCVRCHKYLRQRKKDNN